MNKAEFIQRIIASLENDLAVAKTVLAATHEAATHAESRAENKYDTRGLEAAYLADGQRRRLHEIEQALMSYKNFKVQACDSIRLGALIEVCSDDASRWLYLGPDAAGLKVDFVGQKILVISPQSPLGALLIGKEEGDEVVLKTDGRALTYEVLSVH